MNNIRILTPIVGPLNFPPKELLGDNLNVDFTLIDEGPKSIESLWEETWCVPGLLRAGKEAQEAGIDGVVIDCMGDPGLDVLREVLSIPVLGPAQIAMGIAATLGRKFSLVTVLDRTRPMMEDLVRKYGLETRYAGTEVVPISVLSFGDDPAESVALVKASARRAVEELRADVVVLGCTGWTGMGQEIGHYLQEIDYPVPVIDPLPLTVQVLDSLLSQGLGHSKKAYPFPK
ncbi:aspartate/glutamate racemase family protein [uncultured Ruegeria sp.]|uniref:aspartate/glutamate racemase family protein n=1 Tax=uncultured Ruegeria sp. TaxID=259304 RepID=UPI002621C632|nr:aspartate/glutamate racemase family protein [uncultured Ruegeria sp.]